MIFEPTKLHGAYVIHLEPAEDQRGHFARIFCRNEFDQRGLNSTVTQCSVSYNRVKGTLRGLHYQEAPHAEAKLVICLAGAIYDVIIDLRENSQTYGQWVAVQLSARRPPRMIFIPEGFAHGFQTLEDHSEVFYQVSTAYAPEFSRGIRWDDPAFEIEWPEKPHVISDRDRNFPDFKLQAARHEKVFSDSNRDLPNRR